MTISRLGSKVLAVVLLTGTVGTTTFVASDACASPTASEKDELVQLIYERANQDNYWQSYLFDSVVSFDVPADAWRAFHEEKGVQVAMGIANGIGDYARYLKNTDLRKIDTANNNDRKGNRPRVKAAIDGLKGKISFTLRGQGVIYDAPAKALLFRYLNFMSGFLGQRYGRFVPRGGSAAVTFVFSATATDVSVSVSPDAKTFTVTAPVHDEPNEWDSKIRKGMNRGGER
jgi:hypothetical protein